jgi:hypothetical protein
MEFSKLVAVTGMPGLYELISSKADGAVVRSLEDKTSHFFSTRSHSFSHLESIEVFTRGENVKLAEVFRAMEKSDEKLPDEKDAAAIKKYFEKVYANLDFEKVYNSDMKKMVRWYAVLKKNAIEIKSPEEAEDTAPEDGKTDIATAEKESSANKKKK